MKQTKFTARKRIMASASMLVISAVMLSTSTYAWFTMNRDVTVEGLELNVKADSTYLIVGPESTAAGLQAENRILYEFDPVEELTVFPSAHTDAVTNTSTAGTLANWYYKYADAPDDSASTKTAEAIPQARFETDYVLHKTVYVTLAEGSMDAENLRCTEAVLTDAATGKVNDAVTVLVTSATAKDEEDAGSTFTLAGTQLAATVDDQTAIPLDIWIYYNGNDNTVYTNNYANLDGAEITLTFSVDYEA